jgi:LPS export ABC transporter protein LptC
MGLACAEQCAPRRRRLPARRRFAFVLSVTALALALAAPAPSASAQEAASLHLGTMTFVATRGDEKEMVLRAEKAHMPPQVQVAQLEGVHVVMHNPGGTRNSFEMTCRRGDLQLESADFHAEGDVEGRMADGRRFFTPSLDYDSDSGMVTSDAPVRIREGGHTMRGHGFEYNVRNGHFVLRGGASIVQE